MRVFYNKHSLKALLGKTRTWDRELPSSWRRFGPHPRVWSHTLPLQSQRDIFGSNCILLARFFPSLMGLIWHQLQEFQYEQNWKRKNDVNADKRGVRCNDLLRAGDAQVLINSETICTLYLQQYDPNDLLLSPIFRWCARLKNPVWECFWQFYCCHRDNNLYCFGSQVLLDDLKLRQDCPSQDLRRTECFPKRKLSDPWQPRRRYNHQRQEWPQVL